MQGEGAVSKRWERHTFLVRILVKSTKEKAMLLRGQWNLWNELEFFILKTHFPTTDVPAFYSKNWISKMCQAKEKDVRAG